MQKLIGSELGKSAEAALRASRSIGFHLSSFATRATAQSVEGGRLNVEVRGLTASVQIERLSLHERAAISGQLAKSGELDDVALAAFFAAAAGQAADAQVYLAQLPEELVAMVQDGFR